MNIQHCKVQSASAHWTPDTPCRQPYFTFSSKAKFFSKANIWKSSDDSGTSRTRDDSEDKALGVGPATLTIITWNIDFMRPYPNERMSAALSYLETYLSSSVPSEHAVVILLQEMVASDLQLIQSAPWVRQGFHMTDRSAQNWGSGDYGTCTLIDRRLCVDGVFRVHYHATKMGRDALFVDIAFPSGTPEAGKTLSPPRDAKIRVVNTHLESLRAVPPLQPVQLSTASRFMREPDIHASILGGDLNAIESFDRTLHTDNGLKDAYLELGGEEDGEEGHTWGQMAGRGSRELYGCGRLDKVFFTGGLAVKTLERIGMGVDIGGEKGDLLRGVADLERGWVTDHLGLRADFEVRK